MKSNCGENFRPWAV